MALDLTPEQKAVGKTNFQRTVGKLAEMPPQRRGPNRRQFMQGLVAAGAVLPIGAAAYFGYKNWSGRPVRAALIGGGDEGGVLVGEHNPRYLEIVAVCDIRPTNQRRIFTGDLLANGTPNTGSPRKGLNFHYGNSCRDHIRVTENYRELLEDPTIEAIVIALPLHLHAPVTIDCLRAGKHVLCEKLMAWNIRQCKEMIRAAETPGQEKVLSIGHQRHYSMLYAHAAEVLNSGVLGDVRHIRAQWHRNNARPQLDEQGRPRIDPGTRLPLYRDGWRPAILDADRAHLEANIRAKGYHSMEELVRWRLFKRTGGGLMAELGSHQLDACSIFLGKVHPVAVSAVGGKYFYHDDREVEDHVFCTFEFPGPDYARETRERSGNEVMPHKDLRVVTYSSISTNDFEPYGECVMGSRGTMVVEMEQNAMLWGVESGGPGGPRSTAVTVTAAAGGAPVLSASASEVPRDNRAAALGAASVGAAPPSRGYREEMEHFAYCIRMRQEVSPSDWNRYKPRCDGRAALADAVIALTANQAMARQQRVVFDERWFDPASNEVPDPDMIPQGV
jgi:predicted dehydrogenase